MTIPKHYLISAAVFALSPLYAEKLHCDWSEEITQQWIGRHFWQNSYRDWRQQNGRIEVVKPGGDRSAVITTHAIDSTKAFTLSTELGQLQQAKKGTTGWAGFKLGLKGRWLHTSDWRNQMVTSHGTPMGITQDGTLFIGSIAKNAPKLKNLKKLSLTLVATPIGEKIQLTLTAKNAEETHVIKSSLSQEQITGLFALTSHNGAVKKNGQFEETKRNGNGTLAHWFDVFKAEGKGITNTPERQFGPIAFNQFVTSSGILRMNAQLTPLDIKYTKSIDLEVQKNGSWEKISTAKYHQPSSTALFKVPHWDESKDTPYRVSWEGTGFDGQPYTY
ncbi:MAG: hypothetical protein HRU12_03920, partial [Phaeodactylibacter sp.]|nr:hypothetical protein [Phaeodactylibacter sp.]